MANGPGVADAAAAPHADPVSWQTRMPAERVGWAGTCQGADVAPGDVVATVDHWTASAPVTESPAIQAASDPAAVVWSFW